MTIGFLQDGIDFVPVVNQFGHGHLFTSFQRPRPLGEGRGEGRSYGSIPTFGPHPNPLPKGEGITTKVCAVKRSLYSQLDSITTTARLECQTHVPRQKTESNESPWA